MNRRPQGSTLLGEARRATVAGLGRTTMSERAPGPQVHDQTDASVVDRRTMLARAGAVVAGIVGALTVPSVAAASTPRYVDIGWIAQVNEQVSDAVEYTDRTELYRRIYRGIGCDRAAIALNFDDGPAADYTTVFPLLRDRNLVAGFGVIANNIGATGCTTAANLLAMQDRGMEIICHSATHATKHNPTYTEAQFEAETVGAAATIEAAAALWVQCFSAPGTWYDDLLFDTDAKLQTRFGRILRSRFAGVNAYVGPEYKPLPIVQPYGTLHVTCDALTLAQAESHIDETLARGYGNLLTFHAVNLGTANHMSVADFTSFLDYIVTKQASGLSVVTPTSLGYAGPNTVGENVLYDGSFELSSGSSFVGWSAVNGSPVQTTGGRTEPGCVQVNGTSSVRQLLPKGSFRSLKVTAYAKAAGTSTQARLIVKDTATDRTLYDSGGVAVTSAGWTKIQACVGIDSLYYQYSSTSCFHVWLTGWDTNSVLFDDVKLERI